MTNNKKEKGQTIEMIFLNVKYFINKESNIIEGSRRRRRNEVAQ